jgi:hypothetical protein
MRGGRRKIKGGAPGIERIGVVIEIAIVGGRNANRRIGTVAEIEIGIMIEAGIGEERGRDLVVIGPTLLPGVGAEVVARPGVPVRVQLRGAMVKVGAEGVLIRIESSQSS